MSQLFQRLKTLENNSFLIRVASSSSRALAHLSHLRANLMPPRQLACTQSKESMAAGSPHRSSQHMHTLFVACGFAGPVNSCATIPANILMANRRWCNSLRRREKPVFTQQPNESWDAIGSSPSLLPVSPYEIRSYILSWYQFRSPKLLMWICDATVSQVCLGWCWICTSEIGLDHD